MPATPRGGKKTSADEAAGSNVKVMTRVRLFNSRELKASKDKGEELLPVVRMRPNGDVELHELYKVEGMTSSKVLETFSFDHAFWSMPSSQADCPGCPYATQEDVFNKSGAVATAASFDGYNSCIFAYGQTGSGKTYTMLGSAEDPGVCPRVVDDVFARMNAITADSTAALPMAKGGDDVAMSPLVVNKCELELTFYEIYMEQVRDLFNVKSVLGEYEKPRISQGPFGVTVNGLVHKKPKDCVEAKRWMVKAMNERTTAPTKMNPFSSRSHAVFQLHLTQVDGETGTRKRSTINLVDLAGSEKLNQSEAEGFTAKQAIMINKSLFALRNVIDALVAKAKHVPIRESILTFTLSDALGGNSKTQMIAAISPHSLNLDDTKHTLQYAMKAKKMVTKPTVNQENSEMARMQQAKLIEELKRQLAEGATNNAVLPEGVVAMTSAEVKQQIQEQEDQLQQLEVETVTLKAEFKEKEEKHKELIEIKQRALEQAQVDAKLRKQEQFRKAFQNAFKITKEKQNTEALRKELHAAQEQKRELTRQKVKSEAKQAEAEGKSHALRGAIGVMESQFQEQKHQQELVKEVHAKELLIARQEKVTVQSQNEKSAEKIQQLEHQVAKLSALLEIGTSEKDQLKKSWEADALKHDRKNDSLRNSRDIYKQKADLEEMRVNELRDVFDSQKGDQKTMLQTIVAQQKMIQQQQEASFQQQDNKRRQALGEDQDSEALRYYKQLAHDQQKEIASLTAQLTHHEMQNFDSIQRYVNHRDQAAADGSDQYNSPQAYGRRSSPSPRHSGGGKSPSLGRGASPTRGGVTSHYQDPTVSSQQPRWKA